MICDILDLYTDFLIRLLKPIVEQVRFDFFFTPEDMAYRKGPHIGPELFGEFFVPNYKKIASFLMSHGIDILVFETDGYLNPLIPQCLESGFNCIAPLEVAAGVDAVELREKYGRKLLIMSNIDKRTLGADKKSIEKEVMRKIPLTDEGGYIPGIDHAVPSSIPFKNFQYYNRLLKSYHTN